MDFVEETRTKHKRRSDPCGSGLSLQIFDSSHLHTSKSLPENAFSDGTDVLGDVVGFFEGASDGDGEITTSLSCKGSVGATDGGSVR